MRGLILDTAAAREVVAATRDRYRDDARTWTKRAEQSMRLAAWCDRQRDGLGDGHRHGAAHAYETAARIRGQADRAQDHLDRDTPARVGPVTL